MDFKDIFPYNRHRTIKKGVCIVASSFAAQSDIKREQELFKIASRSARHVQGMRLDGRTAVSSFDLEKLEQAQAGLAGLQLESNLQKPESQAFSAHHQQHRGMAAPVVKFLGAQGRDWMVSAGLNAIAPGVGTLYGALALVRQGGNALAESGIMPPGPQPKGSVVGAMMGLSADDQSFAHQSDKVRGVGVPSRLAAKGPGVPKPRQADIHPSESAAQDQMQRTVAYFSHMIGQKVSGLNKLTEGSHVDLLAADVMPRHPSQQPNPTRREEIAREKGYGDLGDTGIDTKRIRNLATRTYAPNPAFAPSFG